MDPSRRQITKIAREVGKFTQRTLRAESIGPAELDTIHVIRKNPGTTQAEVCKTLGTDKAAMARQVANLEAKGYVERRENPADGRSKLLYALPAADRLKDSKAHIEATCYQWLLDGLDEEDRTEFCRLLNEVYLRSKTESKAGFPHMEQAVNQEGSADAR